jgi:hypothetical protein
MDDELLEVRRVPRKTNRDGKLEISRRAAARLYRLHPPVALAVPHGQGEAQITSMECTCDRRPGDRHLHYFLESPLLTALRPDRQVRILLDGAGGVRIEPA